MNVLVADDDGITRLLLSSALRKMGHAVREAETGAAGWDVWLKERQSLVISDWMMPGMDGLEFCRKIRGAQGSQLTYVILLTARAGKENYLQASAAGVDDFIVKPFEKEMFAAHIRVATRILGLDENLRAANADLERRVSERTAELEEALRAKSEFLSRASHELRTPMNHILGFAQLLELGATEPGERESVEQILSSGNDLLRLINRILEVSESDSADLDFLATAATAAPSRE